MERIAIDDETSAMMIQLKNANGYLECENIILKNLGEHDNNSVSMTTIESHLKHLLKYIEDKIVINKGNAHCENYRYAAGILRAVIATPHFDR